MALPYNEQEKSAIRVQCGLFLLYLVFVIYGSLVPLDFTPHPWDESVGKLLALRNLPLDFDSRSDWATNLVLFIPLTFLAGQSFASRSRGFSRLLIGVLIAVAASALAVGIEFTQMFFPPRTPSQDDIAALSISGAIGVCVHWAVGARFDAWMVGYWQQQKQGERVSRLLKGYLFILFAFNVMPLDLTISPVEIFHKWSDGHLILIPFGGLHGTVPEMLYQVITDVLVWVPAGVLWGMQPGHNLWRVVRKGLLAALVVECLQLFVLSRTTDITSVGLAGVGVALGTLAVQRNGRNALGLSRVSSSTWMAWWLVWLVATLAVFWLPFDFELYRMNSAAFVEAFTRTPLNNYYFESEFIALNEVLRKVGFFIPGGLLLGLASMAKSPRGRVKVSVRSLVFMVLLAFVIETGQLMLPERVCDLTDFLLESLGGTLGYSMARWIGRPQARPAHAPALAKHTTPAALRPRPGAAKTSGWAPMPASSGHAPLDAAREEFHSSRAPLNSNHAPLGAAKPALPAPVGKASHLGWVLLTAIVLGIVLNLPFMPYNVRELLEPGAWSVVSVLGLAAALHWIANGPFLLLAAHRRPYLLALPLTLFGHGLVTWVLLRIAVPLESIYDVAGSPVLNWPWEWELMGRYLGLHAAVMLQVLGAVLLVRTLLRSSTLPDVVYWLMVSLVLAWPLYTLNVTWADTDNLVELMAENASFAAASAMAAGLLMVCLAGSALSALVCRGAPRRKRLLIVVVLASGMATLLFWAGAEHILVKYGQAFSAFQFLLSTDRQHYAHGMDLALRYMVAFAGVTGGLAGLQWMAWRDWLRQELARKSSRRNPLGRAVRPDQVLAENSRKMSL
ncbi:VanZ family protein [Rhodoferax sp.]|uniref:VanZ family protein n=1 Tax=Rhodoferax sp. TaxID=50421 RepID=UPI00374D3204